MKVINTQNKHRNNNKNMQKHLKYEKPFWLSFERVKNAEKSTLPRWVGEGLPRGGNAESERASGPCSRRRPRSLGEGKMGEWEPP